MIWLVAVAFADCPLVLATREAYSPEAGDLAAAGDPGGWDKTRLASVSASRRALVSLHKREFKRYSVEIQFELLDGELRDGLDELAMALAWGEPEFAWEAGRCRGSLWGIEGEGDRRLAVQACEGSLVEQIELTRPVACSRLEGATDRLHKRRKDLGAFTFAQQLDIVAGHRAPWMTEDAMALAFGRNSENARDHGPIHLVVIDVPTPVETVAPQPTPDVAVAEPLEPKAPEVVLDVIPDDGPASRSRVAIEPTTHRFEVVCGSTEWDFELDTADTYRVTATSRDKGSVVRRAARGPIVPNGDTYDLAGLGSLDAEGTTLTLGPWPDASCMGMSAEASVAPPR